MTSFRNHLKHVLIAIAAIFISLTLFSPIAAQEGPELKVNVQDVLKIRVGNWDITRKVYDEWQGLSGDYTVGSNGKISFPYAGLVHVQGVALDEISRTIAGKLRVTIGLASAPAVAIEIASYNPIFVTGDVYRPGQYDFRPGMTVRQGIAMAGGIGRVGSSKNNIEREIVKALGQRRLLTQSQQRLLLRISRLEAETKNASEFVTPAQLQERLMDSGIIDIEKEIFLNNTEALKAQLLSVEDLIELLAIVIEKLDNQLTLNQSDITRTQEDLVAKKELLERGTIRADLVTNLERDLTGLRLREIELTVEKLRAEQSLNEARRDKTDIQKQNRAKLLEQLDQARTELTKLTIGVELQNDLYATALELNAQNSEESLNQPVAIQVIGHGNAKPSEQPSSEATWLRPGDTIVVRIPDAASDTQ